MIFRLELLQRYVSNEDEIEQFSNLGISVEDKIIFKYRRTNPRIDDIDRIVEIPGDDKECIVRFYSGEEMVVKANFDELCIRFNDMENSRLNFLDDELEDLQ